MSCLLNNQRMFPLKAFSVHRSSPWFQKKAHLVPNKVIHFWLKTKARNPCLVIPRGAEGALKFTVRERLVGRETFLYLGSTTELRKGAEFCNFWIKGLSLAQARDACLVTSADRKIRNSSLKKLSGDDELERLLSGISRRDVGSTEISPACVPVGRSTDFVLRYTAGTTLRKGTIIRFIMPRAFLGPGSDYSLRVKKGNAKARCDGVREIVHGKYAAVFTLMAAMPRGRQIGLRYRNAIRVGFAGALEGDALELWYSAVPVFLVEVSVDGGENFMSPLKENTHQARFVPGEPEQIHIALPGRRHRGSRIIAKGIITDRYRNAATKRMHGIEKIELRLKKGNSKPVPLGYLAQYLVDHCRFNVNLPRLAKGIYRVVAVDIESGKQTALSNPLQVIGRNEGDELFWGGMHAHTEMSDGRGTPAEAYAKARDDAMLDFAALGDHGAHMNENDWKGMQELTDNWNADGEFVTLIGYEWNSGRTHINVYSADPIPLFTSRQSFEDGIDHFCRMRDVILTIHGRKGVVDIWQVKGARKLLRMFEVCGVFGLFEDGKPGTGSALAILRSGAKAALMGGSDSHIGHLAFGPKVPAAEVGRVACHGLGRARSAPGLTAVLAGALDRKSLIRAMKKRRVYATTGARILVDFHLSGLGMGSAGKVREVLVKASVHGCARIKEFTVVRDGDIVCRKRPNALDMALKWRDRTVGNGAHFYYLKVVQSDGEIAWTTPIWVTVG